MYIIFLIGNKHIVSSFHLTIQEVSNAMAKQIVANNGELPPSVALSVPVKPVENVGAKNIKSLPRSGRACSGRVILMVTFFSRRPWQNRHAPDF